MQNSEKILHKTKTCPIGNGFYLPTDQAWGTLKVFHVYQLVLSGAFFILFISHMGPSLLGKTNGALFYYASTSYFFITLFSTLFIRKKFLPFNPQAQLRVIFDIIMLGLLMHASGGITSGLGILLAVSVASGGLISGGQCSLAFASIATFFILGEQVYADKTDAFITTAYTYAGVLSASFFTIAALALVLTKRVEASETIALQRGQDITNLQQLNHHLIQHLQSGIIVIDQDFKLRLSNTAAETLLNTPLTLDSPLSTISTEFWQLFNQWLQKPSEHSPCLTDTNNHTRLQLHFNQLQNTDKATYTIFIEDLSPIDQQIQQGKLASLGQLTASIAHEIRNPLGAISHAEQLLSESESIDNEDKRLLEIIHNHSNRVNGIVNDILQLSKSEQILLEEVPLEQWLEKFSQDFKEQFGLPASPITIKFETPITNINFDRNHLKQIIDNLCSNALKHGQLNLSKPTIRIKISKQSASRRVSISICDNGRGIDDTLSKKIFEPFYTSSKTGTGLGLYISSQLAQLNGANLNYSQNPSGGSCFSLLLPSSIKPNIK